MITIAFSRVKLTYGRRPGRCWASVKQQRARWDPPQLGCKRSHKSSVLCALHRDINTVKTEPYQPCKALWTAQVTASGGAVWCFQNCNPYSPPKFEQIFKVKVRSFGIYSTLLSALVKIHVSRMLQVVFFTNECVKTSLHFGHRSNGHAFQSDGTLASAIISWNNFSSVCCTRKKKWKVHFIECDQLSLVKYSKWQNLRGKKKKIKHRVLKSSHRLWIDQ